MRSRWQYTPTIEHAAATAEGPDAPVPSVAATPEAPGAKPPDPRWQQLIELVSRLPPDKAEKLREMLAGDALVVAKSAGIGQVLQALELRRGDGGDAAKAEPLMRKVCVALEPFLVNDDEGEPGTIRRKSLVPWWEASMAQSAALREMDKQYRRTLAENLTAEQERLVEEAMAELARRARGLVLKNTAQSVIEDVRRIGAVLGGGRAFIKALEDLRVNGAPSRPGIEVDDWIVRRFGAAYEALGDNPAFDPVWLGHAVINHLNKPADAAALIHRLTGCTDVHMLEQTDLAPLMDRVIDHLVAVSQRAVHMIKTAARQPKAADLKEATIVATLYFDLAEAVSREVKLERGSAWGQAYMNARKALSDLIPDKLEDFEEVIVDFIDDWDPETMSGEDHPAFLAATAAADLIGALRARAARHGFAMPFTALERRLQDLLGRPMKRPRGNQPDHWPLRKRRLLTGLTLI